MSKYKVKTFQANMLKNKNKLKKILIKTKRHTDRQFKRQKKLKFY